MMIVVFRKTKLKTIIKSLFSTYTEYLVVTYSEL